MVKIIVRILPKNFQYPIVGFENPSQPMHSRLGPHFFYNALENKNTRIAMSDAYSLPTVWRFNYFIVSQLLNDNFRFFNGKANIVLWISKLIFTQTHFFTQNIKKKSLISLESFSKQNNFIYIKFRISKASFCS